MSWLHRVVLRSRGLPGLGTLYRGAYAAAVAAASRALHALEGVEAVYLHRGLTRAGWEPGVSDIDLILVHSSPVSTSQEAAFLRRLRDRLAGLKRLFPMLGDLWVGELGELSRYLRWGGLRAWEDLPDWRWLRGKAIPGSHLAESPEKRRRLDPWVWAFVSHMEISRRYFRPADTVGEKGEADLRKLHLDMIRYAEFASDADAAGRQAPARREQLKRERPELGRLSPREVWLDSAARLSSASRAVLDALAGAERVPSEFPRPAAGGGEESALRSLLARVPAARAAVIDAPYHTYLLLEDGAAQSDYLQAAEALAEARLPGVPLVLGTAAWALCLQSSYLGAPLGRLGHEEVSGGEESGPFADWGARAWGVLPEVPVLPSRLRWEAAAEAASWMALWWRYLWIAPGWNNRFVLFHLYTRALGLRLVLDGSVSGPFSDCRALLARGAEHFPARAESLRNLERLLREEPARGLDAVDRSALAPGHLEALSDLIGGFAQALEFDDAGARPIFAVPRPARASAPASTLFVGNSFTYYDKGRGVHDLAGLLSRLSRRGGRPLETGHLAQSGASLQDHWDSGRFSVELSARPWGRVVLQDYSTGPLKDPARFEDYARRCAEAARRVGAEPVLFSTWLARERDGADWERVDAAYLRLGESLGAPVARVGRAWRKAAAAAPGLSLYDADGEHAGPLGAYLTACVFYPVLIGTSLRTRPGGLEADLAAFPGSTASPAELELLQSAAD